MKEKAGETEIYAGVFKGVYKWHGGHPFVSVYYFNDILITVIKIRYESEPLNYESNWIINILLFHGKIIVSM